MYVFILFALVSALIQTGGYKPESYTGLAPIKALEKFYIEGTELSGGGVIGGLISLPFLVTFHVPGTIIILTALSLIDIILLTNKSIADFFRNIRTFFIQRKKKQLAEETDYDDIQPAVVEDGDEIALRFDKPKVIDFRIEKTARELKKQQKSNERSAGRKAALKEVDVFDEEDAADPGKPPLDLIIGDIKKSKGRKKAARKSTDAVRAEDDGPGLQEIVIKGPAAAKKQNVKHAFPPYDLLIEEASDAAAERGQALKPKSKRDAVQLGVSKYQRGGPTVNGMNCMSVASGSRSNLRMIYCPGSARNKDRSAHPRRQPGTSPTGNKTWSA